MSIKSRIEVLEGAERCPECRLRPTSTHVVYPDEDQPDPEPERCPKCGRLIESCIIRVVYDG